MFLDERGAGLRVTWHPERDLVVLSVWQDDSCVGTFRMLVQDVPRLSGLLAAALGDWVGETGPGAGAGPDTAEGLRGGLGAGVGPGAVGAGPSAAVPSLDVGSGAGADPGTSRGPGTSVGPGAGVGRDPGGGGARLSVQQRLRLSRPVLKLRGLQHRRRGSA
jgi:hypothetical protein